MIRLSDKQFRMESTGRILNAPGGTFTLDPDATAIFVGFTSVAEIDADPAGGALKLEERIEIAEAMVARWQGYLKILKSVQTAKAKMSELAEENTPDDDHPPRRPA